MFGKEATHGEEAGSKGKRAAVGRPRAAEGVPHGVAVGGSEGQWSMALKAQLAVGLLWRGASREREASPP